MVDRVHSGLTASIPVGDEAGGAHTPLTVSEVLNAAADLLDQPGAWMQEDYCDTGGYRADLLQRASCWCVVGAIGAVTDMDGPEAEEWANRVLGPLIPGVEEGYPVTGIPGWNDAPGRTQVEVVKALLQAALAVTPQVGAPA